MFSIVIPTRNRAHLLEYSLQSALHQTFDDYEIVISDNNSSDETRDVVKKYSHSRIRYFRTDRSLPMHDNWNFALNEAHGKWITFLTDRSIISSSLLEKISKVIKKDSSPLIGWNHASFALPTWYEQERLNQLVMPRFTGRTVNKDSRSQLKRLYRLQLSYGHLPRMMNSACRADLISDIIGQVGRFFLPTAVDYSSCAAMLSMTDHYQYIDIPLRVSLIGKEGTGGSVEFGQGGSGVDFFKLLGDDSVPKYVPFKSFFLETNCVAECLLSVKQTMPDHFADIYFDWKQYFVQCYSDLLHMKAFNVDVEQEKAEFFQALGRESLSIRLGVSALISAIKVSSPLRLLLRNMIFRFPFLAPLVQRRIVPGKAASFTNPLDALLYLENFFLGSPKI
jgi:glycosyltransferase involved in cell wall biosynthesis